VCSSDLLLPTLEVFARLGFHDLDLNLNHIVDGGTEIGAVLRALDANGQRAAIVSGGWCDFFDVPPALDATLQSVKRQVALTRELGADRLRLFFGRLSAADYSPRALTAIVDNVRRVADRDIDLLFMFENHDGASSRPEICAEILAAVDRPNVVLTFDPINFEHRAVRTADALQLLLPFVGHVHLKGYGGGAFCGFGEGDVDLLPALSTLIAAGYRGAFTVEYEGSGDRTLRLYQSVQRARAALAGLLAPLR